MRLQVRTCHITFARMPVVIVRLIDTLPHKDGYPPCLVFEAGAFTLAQRFERSRPSDVEQQALVHSVRRSISDAGGVAPV